MKTVSRCTRCILPTSLPSVRVDSHGVCNHCRDYEKRFPAESAVGTEKADQFEALLQRARNRGAQYDCMVPLSGGKDSTYALYVCAKVYGLQCVAVTFDNGYLSEHARTNIKHAVSASGADHIMYSVNRAVLLDVYRLFLLRCGSFCPACMRGIGAAIGLSRGLGIPLIVAGTGRRVEYLSMLPELFQGGDASFFAKVTQSSPLEAAARQLSWMPAGGNWDRVTRVWSKLVRIPYLGKQRQVGIYDYFAPSPDAVLETIEEKMGWSRPSEGVEHMDCGIHGVAQYVQTLKFPELSTTTVHQSGLVRMGRVSRQEALEEDERHRSNSEPPPQLAAFLKEIGMCLEEFRDAAADWRKLDRFRNKSKGWIKGVYDLMAGI